ncbi:MAG TPA: alpha/beta hydrolase [Bauldia sp.]|nr:alpha/beta hydrolase [Bauldia sp.]
MELYPTDGNPEPDGAIVGTVVAADGVRLRYARWRSGTRRSQGTICLFQGRGEAIEKYFETITDLRNRGFAVAAIDWRGQGGSERRLRDPGKAHVDSFAEYDRDLEAFMQQVVLPDCAPPYYALAHSTGGLIAIRAAQSNRARFERMVLLSPLIDFGPTNPPPPFAQWFAASMTAIGLGELDAPGQAAETLLNTPFEGNKLTGDRARYERNADMTEKLPDIFVRGPTFAWVYAAFRAMAEAAAPGYAQTIRVPTLAIIGALDRVVSVTAAERLVSSIRAGAQVVIPGAEHELPMERNVIREQMFAAFDAFVPGG